MVGSNLTYPAVNDCKESHDAAMGQFDQRDFWALVAQITLTIEARYPEGVQVCGQALASLLLVIWRRIAHLNDTDLKGWPASVRVSVKCQDSAGASTGRTSDIGAHCERWVGFDRCRR